MSTRWPDQMKFTLRSMAAACLLAASSAMIAGAAEPAPKLAPGSSFTVSFPEMPPTFHAVFQKKENETQSKGQAMNKTIMGILGLITLAIGVVLLLNPQRFAAAFFLALILCAIGGTLLLLAVAGLTPRGRSMLLWTAGGFVGAVILYLAWAANLPPAQPGRPATPPSGVASFFYTVLPLLPVPVSVLALILSLAGWLPGTRRTDGHDGVEP